MGEDRRGHSFIKSTKSGGSGSFRLTDSQRGRCGGTAPPSVEEKMRNRDRYVDQGLVFADNSGA